MLWRENHPVPLTPKVFDLLLVLVENRGHLLDKEDLQQYVSPFSVALVYVGLGDKDQAFTYLEKAREDQCEWMGWLQATALMNPLRSDPRFADLVRRVGLGQ